MGNREDGVVDIDNSSILKPVCPVHALEDEQEGAGQDILLLVDIVCARSPSSSIVRPLAGW